MTSRVVARVLALVLKTLGAGREATARADSLDELEKRLPKSAQ